MQINEKSKHIFEQNIQKIIKHNNGIEDVLLIEFYDDEVFNIIIKNTCINKDLVNIILEYVNDVIIVTYNMHKILGSLYIDVAICNQQIIYDNYNINFAIGCNKIHIMNVWSECEFDDILLHNIQNKYIDVLSFFNYFMEDIYDEKNYFKCYSGVMNKVWRKGKYLEYSNNHYGRITLINVVWPDKLTTVIDIFKIIIDFADSILLKN
jgi:hypothetical protein